MERDILTQRVIKEADRVIMGWAWSLDPLSMALDKLHAYDAKAYDNWVFKGAFS